MNRIAAAVLLLSALSLSTQASSQAGHPPGAPALNGSHELIVSDREMPAFPRRIDPARLQKEADDLASAAGSIPADIKNATKGLLPKDIIRKLKQIEKLSKQLRNDLNP